VECPTPIMIFTIQKPYVDMILRGEKIYEIRTLDGVKQLASRLGLDSIEGLVGGTVFIHESMGRSSIVAVARIQRIVIVESVEELEELLESRGRTLSERERKFINTRYKGKKLAAIELGDIRVLENPIHYTTLGGEVFGKDGRAMQGILNTSLIPLDEEKARKLCRLVMETNPSLS